eukprot:5623074-Alexandrium_andersonii.AAC.1
MAWCKCPRTNLAVGCRRCALRPTVHFGHRRIPPAERRRFVRFRAPLRAGVRFGAAFAAPLH